MTTFGSAYIMPTAVMLNVMWRVLGSGQYDAHVSTWRGHRWLVEKLQLGGHSKPSVESYLSAHYEKLNF